MNPRTLTTEINLPVNVFIDTVRKKIKGHKSDGLDRLVSFPPHLEFENVSISDRKMVIEKSMKPFDGFSRYRGISETIESEIVGRGEQTILKTQIHLHTAAYDFIKYFIGLGFALSGLTWLILDFDIKILAGLIVVEAVIFFLPKLFQQTAVDDLTFYYNRIIEELIS
ncbi:MAG: hypothetical protein RIF39_09110 [Cyclobacteriaceae bacterium]